MTDDPPRAACRACGSADVSLFYEATDVPTQSCVLFDDVDAATAYPTGSIALGACHICGFVQNTVFDDNLVDYSVPTEESQAYSPRFRQFSEQLVDDLSRRLSLADKRVLEVGCGKGDFLIAVANHGLGSAVGIDPGFLPDRVSDSEAEVTFIRDWFDERHIELTGDLVVARHLLEHISNVRRFTGLLVDSVRRTTGAVLFVELPDVRRILDEGAFWDIYYEHCSYFTLGSLGRLLRRLALEPTRLELGFGDQYLLAEAVVADRSVGPHPAEEPAAATMDAVRAFEARTTRLIEEWNGRFEDMAGRGEKVVLWGGGSKAVGFLSGVGMPPCPLGVVDINPHKQGRYLPGSGVEVQDPRVLADEEPTLVIVMNPIYREEISQQLREMGVGAQVETVESPDHTVTV